VATLPRDHRFATDGVVGLRINHEIDLHVADFGVDQVGQRAGRN
jgi:hypothetical protein